MATITKEQIRELVRRVLLEQDVVAPQPPPPPKPAKAPQPPPPAPPPPGPPETDFSDFSGELPAVGKRDVSEAPYPSDYGVGGRDPLGTGERLDAAAAARNRSMPFDAMRTGQRAMAEGRGTEDGAGYVPSSEAASRRSREQRLGQSEDPSLEERRRTEDRLQGHPEAPNRKKVSESIFAPNHYCIHHGGVYLNGKVHMAEAVNHNYNSKLGRVTHYDMKLSDGRIFENVPAEYIQVTKASLAEEHKHEVPGAPKRDEDEKERDEIEEGSGDRNEIEEGSGDRNDKDREQGHGKQRQKAGTDGSKGELEEASDKEWHDNQLFEALKRKWTV